MRRFNSLVKVMGLDYSKTYETQEELDKLRYGKVIIATDADVDGKGNIFCLIINFFTLFWPNLVKRKFITRFNTPIIRALPKSKKYVEEFYTLKEYNQWIQEKYGSEEKVAQAYNIKYYKGLGSHRKQEIPTMFEDFEKRLCYYQLDSQALNKLNAYFGYDTKQRKILLSTPVDLEETIGKVIDISELLDIDLKEYQRDNIMRKLPHICDGLVPSRRKVLYTARHIFTNDSQEMKVATFAAKTSEFAHYHHGEASLWSVVTKMAQDFPGARNLPLLRPLGQFGTRKKGGNDAASPRYIFTRLNIKLSNAIYPKADEYLLPYTFDDGVRTEPEYYCPVIPMAVLENIHQPATGWKIKTWARDIKQMFVNTKALVMGKIKNAKPMKVWHNKIHSTVRVTKKDKKTYSVGKYRYYEKENVIIVKSLPLGKFSAPFIGDSADPKAMRNKEYFQSVIDETNYENVRITFQLTDGAWKEIEANYGNADFDAVEDLLNLKTALTSNINMIDVDGSVYEFKNYETVIDKWFKVRKELYAKRIEREITLSSLMITYLKNIIRFADSHANYKITTKTSLEDFNKILKKNKYDTFNHTLLTSPKFTPVEEMKEKIINGDGCSYDYLINLSYRNLTKSACDKRKGKIKRRKGQT